MILIIISVGVIALAVGMFVIPSGGSSWVKEDGTIIEWDGDGHCRVLHPNGRLDEY